MNQNPDLDRAAKLLADLVAKLGVEAEVSVTSEEPPLLSIELEDPSALIGHRGDGMKALQHLLRVMLVRQSVALPVLVDVAGYRAKQHAQLEELAKRKADEVRQTGRLAVLQPMSSYERRLIHVALAEADDVTTESIGEAGNRRVMIKQKD